VTSFALSDDESKALATCCDGYVAKPFSPRHLLAKVREFTAYPCLVVRRIQLRSPHSENPSVFSQNKRLKTWTQLAGVDHSNNN
jgi:DNA-binding response OmpR family regulator